MPKQPILFTHLRWLDVDWKPGPGQKYADAPKARMQVTRMTKYAVYYRYADGGGKFCMDRATWDRDYAPALDATQDVSQ